MRIFLIQKQTKLPLYFKFLSNNIYILSLWDLWDFFKPDSETLTSAKRKLPGNEGTIQNNRGRQVELPCVVWYERSSILIYGRIYTNPAIK